jgi:Sec-independent protein secretion pathway component TatC
MSESPRASGWKLRGTAYSLLAVIAAVATSSPDAVTMLPLFLGGVVLFELGFLAYRCSGVRLGA